MVATVNVTVQATDQNGDPVANARISAKLTHAEVDADAGYILPEEIRTTADENGVAVIELWPNELGSTQSYYVVSIQNPATGRTLKVNATIPNADCNLHEVAELPPYEGKTDGQLALDAALANVANIAAGLKATSTTPLPIGLGVKVFTTQTGKQFNTGQFVMVTDQANPANFMFCQITSYAGTTLTLDAQAIGGSGTIAAWNISVSGARGAVGEQGPIGETGSQGPIGETGPAGSPGLNGSDGENGLSAFEVAQANGFGGTQADWLASLVGPQGEVGPIGPQGETGPAGNIDNLTAEHVETALGYVPASPSDLAAKADQATTYTKAETDSAIAAVVGAAPETLNALNELAAALGNDPNFAATTMAQIGEKADQTALDAHTGDTANPHGVTKAQVGLSNVDNTSDANKPISTAQQTALDGKEPTIAAAGNTTSYWRGDKSWRDFATDVRAAVLTGLSTATNAAITSADSVLTALGKLQRQFTDHFADTANPHAVTKSQVGLSNVDNTSDANKPVSTAQQTALDAKASKTGAETLTNKTLTTPTIDGYTEGVSAPAAGAAFSLDISQDTIHGITTNANTTITIPAPAVGKSFRLEINFGGTHTIAFSVTGGSTLGYATGVTYAPTSTASKTDVLNFVANAAGTKWLVTIVGQGY